MNSRGFRGGTDRSLSVADRNIGYGNIYGDLFHRSLGEMSVELQRGSMPIRIGDSIRSIMAQLNAFDAAINTMANAVIVSLFGGRLLSSMLRL